MSGAHLAYWKAELAFWQMLERFVLSALREVRDHQPATSKGEPKCK